MSKHSSLRIFLVDDDTLCLTLYQQFLKQLGYTCVELFTNGTDCLDKLEMCPDVIFLDHNMEDLNGLDVLKRIKLFDPNILVLFISGQENMEVAVNTIKHGAMDYLIKSSLNPERMKVIMEKVELLKKETDKENKSFFKKIIGF